MATPISPDFDPFLSPPPLTKIHPAFRDETPSPSKPRRLASIINTFRSPKRARSTFDLSTPPPPPPPVPCFSERTNKWKPLPPLPVLRSWARPAERPITPSRTSFSRPFTPGKRDISGSTEGSRVVSTIDEEPSTIEDAVTDVVDASTEIEASVLVHTIASSAEPLQSANEAKDDCSDTAGQLYLDTEESVGGISSYSPSIEAGTVASGSIIHLPRLRSQRHSINVSGLARDQQHPGEAQQLKQRHIRIQHSRLQRHLFSRRRRSTFDSAHSTLAQVPQISVVAHSPPARSRVSPLLASPVPRCISLRRHPAARGDPIMYTISRIKRHPGVRNRSSTTLHRHCVRVRRR